MFKGLSADTICATSTAPGIGGISVIRVSGPQAASLTRHLCPFLPESPKSHQIYHGFLRDPASGEAVDEVLLSFFATGRSYTGEETVEISCHGSSYLSQAIVQKLIDQGARLAQPGEFTFRAFMNGRLDLVQAESVLALIESQSHQSARVALRQLEGGLSKALQSMEEALVQVLAHVEANIDFATEELESLGDEEIKRKVATVERDCHELLESYRRGKVIREGLQVTLVGRPNVGKSSLLNQLLKEEKAIVTEVPGTTRDVIEGRLVLNGLEIHLVDCAGLRITEDPVEAIGVKRSREAAEKADVLLWVVDTSQMMAEEDLQWLKELAAKDQMVAVILNKSDACSWALESLSAESVFWEQVRMLDDDLSCRLQDTPCFFVSAKTAAGLGVLMDFLGRVAESRSTDDSAVLTQARHYELMQKLADSLRKAQALLAEKQSGEFVAFELQEGLRALYEMTGKEFDEQVIDRIFKEFCLGK